MAKDTGIKARSTSWCSSCNVTIEVGDTIWPRFEKPGWICTPCANAEQPTPTDRLLARLDYLGRMSRVATLRPDELETMHTILTALGVAAAPRGGAVPWTEHGKRGITVETPEGVLGLVEDAIELDFNPTLAVRSVHYVIHLLAHASSAENQGSPGNEHTTHTIKSDGMTGAEARLTCEAIGLPRRAWANLLGVTLEEVRRWEFSESSLPPGATSNIESWRGTFNHLLLTVRDQVAQLTTEPPCLAIYATDRSYWAHGGMPPTPASMHRAAVARVLQDQPTLRIVWGSGETPPRPPTENHRAHHPQQLLNH